MIRLIRSELHKIKWPVVLLLMLMDMGASFALAADSVRRQTDFFAPNWFTLYFQAVSFHGLFFLPLFAGLFAAFLCFCEHKHNAWKIMLTLPYSRKRVYAAKLAALLLLLALLQLLFCLAYLLTGMFIQVEGSLPWRTVLYGAAGGWLCVFPLSALLLYLATRLKSFGAALLFSFSMVVPNIVLTGLTSVLGAWFPAAPPYYAMFPQGINLSPQLDSLPFAGIVAFTFALYLTAGIRSFVRRDWG